MFTTRLPSHFDVVDLAEWATIDPEAARRDGLVADPATMLVYSRTGVTSYDEIAERIAASTPWDPATGLTGRITMRVQNERARRRRRPPDLEAVRVQQDLLGHRPLDLGAVDGRLAYTVTGSDIVFRSENSAVEWRFSLTFPPSALASAVRDDDVPPPFSWRIKEPMQGLWWLPLDVLLARGEIDRWQDLRHALVGQVGPGGLPLFISHRWLATDQPDPSGRQARLLAWQLVAALCEAAHVAAARGLHQSRRQSTMLGQRVGIGASDLAEAVIVSVLRPAFDDELLGQAVAEARSMEHLLGADLVAHADVDEGLERLRATLDERPVLSALTRRIHVWIDYCCLPQPPRTESEQTEFQAGLRLLNAAQLLGRTVILLDEVEEYTRRAWCLLEAMTADRMAGCFDVLSGMPENSDPAGSPYGHLSDLLLDLPHVVWRALLDAEVFGALDWRSALDRLEISVTDPDDLPYIYERLRAIPAPNRLHTVRGDLITGIFPLPSVSPGEVAVPEDGSRPAEIPPTIAVGTLAWDKMLTLDERGPVGATSPPYEGAAVPFVRWAASGDGRPEAHIAIVAACEGEAVMMADWVDRHVAELESACGVDATSRSWVADDVAPVGAIVFGGMGRQAIAAPNWIIVTMSVRRDHCSVTAMHAATARRAGRALAWVIADDGRVEGEGEFPLPSVTRAADGEDGPLTAPAPDGTVRLGGVYRHELAAFLRGDDDG